jgi:hypothetical protein
MLLMLCINLLNPELVRFHSAYNSDGSTGKFLKCRFNFVGYIVCRLYLPITDHTAITSVTRSLQIIVSFFLQYLAVTTNVYTLEHIFAK